MNHDGILIAKDCLLPELPLASLQAWYLWSVSVFGVHMCVYQRDKQIVRSYQLHGGHILRSPARRFWCLEFMDES
eukprot:c40205_g1_i1 orf=373-597(+)